MTKNLSLGTYRRIWTQKYTMTYLNYLGFIFWTSSPKIKLLKWSTSL